MAEFKSRQPMEPHDSELTRLQVADRNLYDIQRRAILELDHLDHPARHVAREPVEKDLVCQVYPGSIDARCSRHRGDR